MISRFKQFELTDTFDNGIDFMHSLEVRRPHIALFDVENDWETTVKNIQLDYPQITLLIPATYSQVSATCNNFKKEIYPVLEREMRHEDSPATKRLLERVSWMSNALVIQEMLLDYIDGKIKQRVWSESGLSDMEERILSLSILGWANQEIAEKLRKSRRTIEWHKENIGIKINADAPVDLIRYGIRHELEIKFGYPKKIARKQRSSD